MVPFFLGPNVWGGEGKRDPEEVSMVMGAQLNELLELLSEASVLCVRLHSWE